MQLCKRKSTCKYLSDVVREIDLEADTESCFNDLVFFVMDKWQGG
jgi:hypothetical protein